MGNLIINNNLSDIAKYMTKAVKRYNWDFKDLIHYFEADNNFDYKLRVKLWEEHNMFEKPKTYKNILKFITELVKINLEVSKK